MGRGRTQSIGGTQKRWGCPGRTRNTLSSVVPPADLSGAAGISVTDIPPRQLNVASGLCSSGQAREAARGTRRVPQAHAGSREPAARGTAAPLLPTSCDPPNLPTSLAGHQAGVVAAPPECTGTHPRPQWAQEAGNKSHCFLNIEEVQWGALDAT